MWLSPSIPAQSGRSDLARQQPVAAFKLDRVALAVAEAERFDARKALQRPGQAGGKSCPPENSSSAVSDDDWSFMRGH